MNKPLCHNPQVRLTQADRATLNLTGKPNIMFTSDQMYCLPHLFNAIADPRARDERRHRLSTVLSFAAAATRCVLAWRQSGLPQRTGPEENARSFRLKSGRFGSVVTVNSIGPCQPIYNQFVKINNGRNSFFGHSVFCYVEKS